nr:MAG TPA: hypothetical protein [Caudoviricetes sp.]
MVTSWIKYYIYPAFAVYNILKTAFFTSNTFFSLLCAIKTNDTWKYLFQKQHY